MRCRLQPKTSEKTNFGVNREDGSKCIGKTQRQRMAGTEAMTYKHMPHYQVTKKNPSDSILYVYPFIQSWSTHLAPHQKPSLDHKSVGADWARIMTLLLSPLQLQSWTGHLHSTGIKLMGNSWRLPTLRGAESWCQNHSGVSISRGSN